jgi:hypothetical protein
VVVALVIITAIVIVLVTVLVIRLVTNYEQYAKVYAPLLVLPNQIALRLGKRTIVLCQEHHLSFLGMPKYGLEQETELRSFMVTFFLIEGWL